MEQEYLSAASCGSHNVTHRSVVCVFELARGAPWWSHTQESGGRFFIGGKCLGEAVFVEGDSSPSRLGMNCQSIFVKLG